MKPIFFVCFLIIAVLIRNVAYLPVAVWLWVVVVFAAMEARM